MLDPRVVRVVASLACASCQAQFTSAVRAQASPDLRCPEDRIVVTELDTGSVHLTDTKVFRAEGCGGTGTYVCKGWNSYDQTPACAPGRAPR